MSPVCEVAQKSRQRPSSGGNFDAFIAAGGNGVFEIFTRAPSLNGHFLVNDPDLWTNELDAFVAQLPQ